MSKARKRFLALGVAYFGLAVFLMAGVTFASTPKANKYEFFNNAGGLNSKLSSISIDDDEASEINNMSFSRGGSIQTRSGYIKYNSTAITGTPSITGLFYNRFTDGTRMLLATTSNSKLYKSEMDGTMDDVTGSFSLPSGQDSRTSFTVGRDMVFIGFSDTALSPVWVSSTGAVVSLAGNPPEAKYNKFNKNVLFWANGNQDGTLYKSRVWYTPLGDLGSSKNVERYPDEYFFDVAWDDGTEITALFTILDTLYIGKDTSIWRLSGSDHDSFVLERMIVDTGPIAHEVVQVIDNVAYFMDSKNRIVSYDGGIKVVDISDRIETTLNALNENRNIYAVSSRYNDDYQISVTDAGGSTHDTIFYYDTFQDAWTIYKGIAANAMAIASTVNDPEVWYTGNYAGRIYEQDSGTNDDGTAIDWYYTSKQYRFPDVWGKKTFRAVDITYNTESNYNINVEHRTDFASTGVAVTLNLNPGGSLWDSGVYGTATYGGIEVADADINVNNSGEFFSLKIWNDQLNQPATILGWKIYVEPIERR